MEKITSFTINHLKLLPGIYVSRKDQAGDVPHSRAGYSRVTHPFATKLRKASSS